MTEQMKFKMRFVGFKEDGSGELKPTSPGGFKRHEIRELPFEYSLSIWWEIVDAIPDLVIPEPRYEDSVFIEEVFVPVDAVDTHGPLPPETGDTPPFIELEASEETVSHSAEPVQTLTVKVEPSLEPGEAFVVTPDAIEVNVEELELVVGDVDPGKVVKIEGLDEEYHDPDAEYRAKTVKELKAIIKQHGGEVDSQWRKADLIREARKLEESSSPT